MQESFFVNELYFIFVSNTNSIMKPYIVLFLALCLLLSCRTQKYTEMSLEEMESEKTFPVLVQNDEIPCINKMYCDKTYERTIENYYQKNLFVVQEIKSGFRYKLCLEQNSNYKIDTTFEFIVDTLQYHCPIN